MSDPIDSTPAPNSTPSAVDEAALKELLQFDDLEATALRLTAYKFKAKATGNPYFLAQLLSHLGHVQTRLRRFEQARETLNEADFVLIEAAQRDPHESPVRHRAWIRYMLERSRYFSLTGWEASARSMAEQAQGMAQSTAHFDLFQEALSLTAPYQAKESPDPH